MRRLENRRTVGFHTFRQHLQEDDSNQPIAIYISNQVFSTSTPTSRSVILMKQGSQRQDTEEAQQPLALASNAAAAYVETEGSAYARVTGKHLAGEAEKTVVSLTTSSKNFRATRLTINSY